VIVTRVSWEWSCGLCNDRQATNSLYRRNQIVAINKGPIARFSNEMVVSNRDITHIYRRSVSKLDPTWMIEKGMLSATILDQILSSIEPKYPGNRLSPIWIIPAFCLNNARHWFNKVKKRAQHARLPKIRLCHYRPKPSVGFGVVWFASEPSGK
jgi:hypothetical protein